MMHDLTGSEHMPTRYQDGAAESYGFGKPDRTCLGDIRTRLQGLTGSGYHIEHAYEVSGRGCRILRVRTNRFNMSSRYQVGAAEPHG